MTGASIESLYLPRPAHPVPHPLPERQLRVHRRRHQRGQQRRHRVQARLHTNRVLIEIRGAKAVQILVPVLVTLFQ